MAARPLPGPLPDGETIVWEGAPSRAGLARDAFGLRLLAGYFAVLLAVSLAIAASQGRPLGSALASFLPTVAAGVAVLGFVALFAALTARTTRYTITSRRLILQIGVALPVTFNVPFATVDGAGLKLRADGSGDIPLRLVGSGRIAFVHLWPHARPWHVRRPEPMLRSVPDAARVAALLARALADAGAPAAAGQEPSRLVTPSGAAGMREPGFGLPPVAA